MKDYRQYSGHYNPREWEKDNGWLIARLEFLWTLREFYPEVYIKGFNDEKYDIYTFYPKLIQAANIVNNNQYASNYNYYLSMFKEWDTERIEDELTTLMSIKENDMDSFLRKRLYIKYILLREYSEKNK